MHHAILVSNPEGHVRRIVKSHRICKDADTSIPDCVYLALALHVVVVPTYKNPHVACLYDTNLLEKRSRQLSP